MIFISYRKEDSGDLAFALAERLAKTYGTDMVFLDRNRIDPGANWKNTIDEAVARSTVVLALIGRGWLTAYDEFGRRRIDREDDVLAHELATAMERGVPVIPLYIHGTPPLPEDAFPASLRDLARRQGLTFDLAGSIAALLARVDAITGLCSGETIDSAGQLPQGGRRLSKPWLVPDSIGQLFKGREAAIKGLWEQLHDKSPVPSTDVVRRHVVCGLGGIGKTRLAIEYAWTYASEYAAALFVVADSPEQLRRGVAELAGPAGLNLPEWECPDEETRMGAVLRWLSLNPGWLLIIDNADDPKSVDAVERIMPRLRGGQVIITSRNTLWGKYLRKCELDVLPQEAATSFLLERTAGERRQTQEDAAVAVELASELGCLALALEQAGAYIQCRGGAVTLRDYLTRWRDGKAQVRTYCDKRLMHYERSVAATWETTMRALDANAVALFRILAWFAPSPIPHDRLLSDGVAEVIGRSMSMTPPEHADIDPEVALAQLIAYSMTRRTDDQGTPCVGLHRLVLQITRERMPIEMRIPTIKAAACLIERYAPKESYRPETWQQWRLLVPHAEAIWTAMEVQGTECWCADLMKMLALYYLGQDREEAAVSIQRKLLSYLEKSHQADDPLVLEAKNDLALMLKVDLREEKERLYSVALEGRRRHGEETTETAETMFNYGTFLSQTGRQAEAEPLLRRALEVLGKVNGSGHWRALMAENSLGDLLLGKKEFAEAERLHRHALQVSDETLGSGHKDTFRNAASLCELLMQTGCSEEAKTLTLRYVTARGTANDATAMERRVMAMNCVFMQAYEQAEHLLRSVLQVDFEVPGTYCHLARVCLLTGRPAEAKVHTQSAWDRRDQAPSYVVPRILWLRLLFALADGGASESLASSILGDLRVALQDDKSFGAWKMDEVLVQIRKGAAGELDQAGVDLLGVIIEALNDKSARPKLDEYLALREATHSQLRDAEIALGK